MTCPSLYSDWNNKSQSIKFNQTFFPHTAKFKSVGASHLRKMSIQKKEDILDFKWKYSIHCIKPRHNHPMAMLFTNVNFTNTFSLYDFLFAIRDSQRINWLTMTHNNWKYNHYLNCFILKCVMEVFSNQTFFVILEIGKRIRNLWKHVKS